MPPPDRDNPTAPLRLVGANEVPRRRDRHARRSVITENRTSGTNRTLDPTDPRWTLAVHAARQLQGTAMTPERRDRVLKTARAMGMRPFDANVIIAIAQDHARRGASLSGAGPMLSMLPHPRERRASPAVWFRWLAAVVTAFVIAMLLGRWLLAG